MIHGYLKVKLKKYKKNGLKNKKKFNWKKEVDTLNLTYFMIEVPNLVYKLMVMLRLF